MRSARVDAFAAALLSQRLAGGDLAGLLRRFAAGAAERDRVAEDARSATAQARFTGLLVVAMPSGGALFAELLQPGFLAKVARARRPPRSLLALAAALQLGASSRSAASRGWSSERPRRSRGSVPASAARLRGSRAGALLALIVAPAAPGRLACCVAAALPAAGFVAPDALRARGGAPPPAPPGRRAARRARPARGRRRRRPQPGGRLRRDRRLRAAGRSPRSCGSRSPSSSCGRPLVGGPGGSPRARAGQRDRDPLRRRSSARAASARRWPSSCAARPTALRRDQRRAVEERAARAAPKIQLVVALVLVPSVLLMIAAGLIANADVLLGGF